MFTRVARTIEINNALSIDDKRWCSGKIPYRLELVLSARRLPRDEEASPRNFLNDHR